MAPSGVFKSAGCARAAAGRRRPAQAGGWRYAAILTLLGMIPGCVDYQAVPLEPQRSADAFSARRLDESRLHDALIRLIPQAVAAWPPQEWDRGELLAVALTQNQQLAVAQAAIKEAQSREISAAETPNPDLTLQSEYARHDAHPWLYGISLNWLLRPAERRRLDIEIARLDTSNARWQLMDQVWTVRSLLAAALTDWESARRRLALLDRLAAAQDKLIALEQQRVKAGEDAPTDLVVSEQARIQIEQQTAELRTAANTAQAAAAKALGLPPQALDGVSFAWPDWGEPPPLADEKRREAREQALLSRADLGVAMSDYAAAEIKLRLSVARQYPEFTLSPGYYWDHGIAKFPFDVGFTLPFNRNRGEIAEARAARELAGQRMLALQADIYGEIEAAERSEHIARDSAAAAERQLGSARRQKLKADLGLRLGASDAQDELSAEIVATRAELELVQMRAQLQSSRNNLEDVLHAPLSGPELALASSVSALVPGAGS